jgi:hypothetical protein
MNEIAPGIFHWTAHHENIGMRVSSYYVEPAGVVIDPMLPDDGLDVFEGHEPPRQALLTTRHHYRACAEFASEYPGLVVSCSSAGLHEFSGTDREVQGFDDGDEVAPGIVVAATNGISPDDVTFLIDHGGGALSFGDGLAHFGGAVGFVPDEYMDEPPVTKQKLVGAYRGLLERDFDFEHLLFAHGEPLLGKGRSALSSFVMTPGGVA